MDWSKDYRSPFSQSRSQEEKVAAPGQNDQGIIREREREGWGIMAEDIKVSVPGGLFLETLSEQGSTQVGTFQVSRCLDTDGDPGGESP